MLLIMNSILLTILYLFALKRNQKSQLLEIVKDCGGFVDCNTEERITSIERAFKQVKYANLYLVRIWCLIKIFISVWKTVAVFQSS